MIKEWEDMISYVCMYVKTGEKILVEKHLKMRKKDSN